MSLTSDFLMNLSWKVINILAGRLYLYTPDYIKFSSKTAIRDAFLKRSPGTATWNLESKAKTTPVGKW